MSEPPLGHLQAVKHCRWRLLCLPRKALEGMPEPESSLEGSLNSKHCCLVNDPKRGLKTNGRTHSYGVGERRV